MRALLMDFCAVAIAAPAFPCLSCKVASSCHKRPFSGSMCSARSRFAAAESTFPEAAWSSAFPKSATTPVLEEVEDLWTGTGKDAVDGGLISIGTGTACIILGAAVRLGTRASFGFFGAAGVTLLTASLGGSLGVDPGGANFGSTIFPGGK
ncbi:exported hypothetical protein [Gammaproteobacteria bacterium]